MRIETVGTLPTSRVNGVIKDIVKEVLSKTEFPSDIKYKVKNVSCDIVFMCEGKEQVLTVNHGGLDEMFTVKCALDNKYNIIKQVNNSEKSFIDEYVRRTVSGTNDTVEYEEIKSEYSEGELEYITELSEDGKKEVTYKLKGKDKYVLRYYVYDKLVGELTTKEQNK